MLLEGLEILMQFERDEYRVLLVYLIDQYLFLFRVEAFMLFLTDAQ